MLPIWQRRPHMYLRSTIKIVKTSTCWMTTKGILIRVCAVLKIVRCRPFSRTQHVLRNLLQHLSNLVFSSTQHSAGFRRNEVIYRLKVFFGTVFRAFLCIVVVKNGYLWWGFGIRGITWRVFGTYNWIGPCYRARNIGQKQVSATKKNEK